MASVTKDQDGKGIMADKGGDAPQRKSGGGSTDGSSGGFFTIYKSGQGYWTRLLTFLGFLLVGALTAHFAYERARAFNADSKVALAIGGGLFLVWAIIQHWIMNKPANVDFLIATDSEMKKVNWTSREQLIGSTKVVILFMFLISATLFVFDIIFGYLFWLIGVLHAAPFGG